MGMGYYKPPTKDRRISVAYITASTNFKTMYMEGRVCAGYVRSVALGQFWESQEEGRVSSGASQGGRTCCIHTFIRVYTSIGTPHAVPILYIATCGSLSILFRLPTHRPMT
ncbi:hypothetical protein P154DRAFT_257202 [Amniculicola lignicola CBS 123094]|uniref:Uncharacterized protein n=1 Tax=Amniculicola lignicola CBS 123094 TaxID=1392246 RepID=A0A6A5X213_9PLEO|nr:hypothetical protein P154DRAFT_257202 [Amniculicola lignicola CBS 123094]